MARFSGNEEIACGHLAELFCPAPLLSDGQCCLTPTVLFGNVREKRHDFT